MFGNPVLFQGFGVSWTVVKCFAVAGAVLMSGAAVTFMVLVRHLKVHSYRLSPQEALQMMMDPNSISPTLDGMPSAMTMRGKAVGGGIKMEFTIDSLRKAARRGDWLTFWAEPAMACAWFVGTWMVLMIPLIKLNVPLVVQIITTAFIGLMVALVLFIPWAAIYTRIDLEPEPAGPGSDCGAGNTAEPLAAPGSPVPPPVFKPTVVDPFANRGATKPRR